MSAGGPAPEIAGTSERPRIRAVIFDAVGTLLRLREPVGETYARLARAYGVELPPSRLEEAFSRCLAAAPPNVHPGQPLSRIEALERDWWRNLVRATFRSADGMVRFEDFDAFFEALFRLYGTAAAWELAPGTRDALHTLRREGRAAAILSNFDQRLRAILREFGIHDCFSAVTLPADAGAAKPDRAIFDVCLKRLGLPGHRTVYVGDHAREDLEGSRAAAMIPIDVLSLLSLKDLPERIRELEGAG
jgi:putative hydrolase of the HAD superfamily